jgi:hypothetical protein
MPIPALPKLLSFLLVHAAIGFLIAGLFVMALVGFDIGGFGSLVGRSTVAPLALGVLTAFLGLTFASVQMGVAIMLLPKNEDGGPGGGLPHPAKLAPVRIGAVPRR